MFNKRHLIFYLFKFFPLILGGAGGKGVWGKLGSEIDETGDCRDVNDPNYDSDTQGDYKLVAIEPILNDEELEKAVKPILQEYLEHGNTIEESLYDLNIGGTNGHKIVKMAIQLGLDRHNNQRELISQLISDLYNNVLSGVDISSGFDDLLNSIDDLRLDTPDAPNLLGQFIARCIADDCLAPKFITNYKGKVENKYFKEALDKANVLITMKQGMAHLDNIWGVGGGNRPVKYLTNKMVALLKEYLSSEDKQEAMRCIIELEVPHFHHEVVYQACDIAIENSTEPVINQMVSLIKFLTVDTVVITLDQFEKGIKRICDDIHDISLDVPNAAFLLDQMCVKLREVRVIGDGLFQELSNKGRKRFVSEGDGGLMKPL
ncbi:hypothetical protein HELRODRAFT_91647 [Helobdella robusta]|uniref:Programmed cell death protein 4 n=1 Tax=Helobdella robusta TaxID=6412 RepID=T1G871_HELRO|nr:hypothetical protein HELRODRAFT_91647 [Helobdella robusta]ESO11158.1 hypothetical protein HELRODRAFT_91647 [Helobdella robusta]